MRWTGLARHVKRALAEARAERDVTGLPIVTGGDLRITDRDWEDPDASTLVIGPGAEFWVKGKPCPLARLMQTWSAKHPGEGQALVA